MPMVRILAGGEIPEDKRREIIAEASRAVSEVLGKPDAYMMASIEKGAICMGGNFDKCAFIEVRSIGGLSLPNNEALSARLCELMESRLGIPPNAVYLNFIDMPASNWGWNKSTFA